MSNADSTNGNHHPDDDRKELKDRIDANPPYGAGTAGFPHISPVISSLFQPR